MSLDAWLALADRQAELRRLREIEDEGAVLVFDKHDQARVVYEEER